MDEDDHKVTVDKYGRIVEYYGLPTEIEEKELSTRSDYVYDYVAESGAEVKKVGYQMIPREGDWDYGYQVDDGCSLTRYALPADGPSVSLSYTFPLPFDKLSVSISSPVFATTFTGYACTMEYAPYRQDFWLKKEFHLIPYILYKTHRVTGEKN